MPKYDFRCEACEAEFSESLPMGTTDLPACPTCKKATTVRRLIRAPMVHFKGSGFYKTDSSKTVTTKPKVATEAKPADIKAETKPAEPKAPEKKPDAPK